MAEKTQTRRPKTGLGLGVLILGLVPLVACPTLAHADEDPFAIEGSHWMSFDHYKDADQRGHIAAPSSAVEAPAADSNAEIPVAQPVAATTTPAPAVPAIAALARPIDLPVMPGLNKDMGLQVNSTEDEKTRQITTPVITTDAPPDIHLPVKGWQAPVSVGDARKQNSEDPSGNGDNPQLAVRMTYLPDAKILPVASPEHASAQSLINAIAMQQHKVAKKAEDPRTPTEKAACDAIDAYKKQQLDAIQSDRQTLKALQDAIASLGLQKQLDFIAGKDSALNSSAQQTPTSIDVSTPTTIR